MQREKNSSVTQSHETLFQDRYGILALAAHATLTKTPKSSKIAEYLYPKFRRSLNNAFKMIKQRWRRNNMAVSDWVWADPSREEEMDD